MGYIKGAKGKKFGLESKVIRIDSEVSSRLESLGEEEGLSSVPNEILRSLLGLPLSRKYSDRIDRAELVGKLREEGLNLIDIARELDLPYTAVHRALETYNLRKEENNISLVEDSNE